MERHGGTFHAPCHVKEVNLKGLYTVWLQLMTSSNRQKYRDNKKISVYQGVRVGGKKGMHGTPKILKVLKLFYITHLFKIRVYTRVMYTKSKFFSEILLNNSVARSLILVHSCLGRTVFIFWVFPLVLSKKPLPQICSRCSQSHPHGHFWKIAHHYIFIFCRQMSDVPKYNN